MFLCLRNTVMRKTTIITWLRHKDKKINIQMNTKKMLSLFIKKVLAISLPLLFSYCFDLKF